MTPNPVTLRNLFTAASPKPLTVRERLVRGADMKRAQCRLGYINTLEGFLFDQYDQASLEKTADARVQSCVDYIGSYVRLRVEEEWRDQPRTPATELGVQQTVALTLQDIAARHPDTLVQRLAWDGQWRIHLLGSDFALSFHGLPAGTPPPALA